MIRYSINIRKNKNVNLKTKTIPLIRMYLSEYILSNACIICLKWEIFNSNVIHLLFKIS